MKIYKNSTVPESKVMTTISEKARDYAILCHNNTNHKYDKVFAYSMHLQMVVDVAMKFIHLVPEEYRDAVIAGCWVHDVIEDCRETYNDVKKATNEQVAELAYALTNEKGKNRKERASDKYYEGIRNTPYAVFIKICDRAANYEYSKRTGSRMAEMYEKEMPEFITSLIGDATWKPLEHHPLKEMFDYLTEISAPKIN